MTRVERVPCENLFIRERQIYARYLNAVIQRVQVIQVGISPGKLEKVELRIVKAKARLDKAKQRLEDCIAQHGLE